MNQEYKIIHYIENGRDIFQEWMNDLKDRQGYEAIRRTIKRVKLGNLGDNHFCRDGVWEFRIRSSAGYRVYYSISGKEIILLLCGGSKRTQNKDIDKAVEYLKRYMDIITTITHKEATIQSYMHRPDLAYYSLNEAVDDGDLEWLKVTWQRMIEAANRLQVQPQNKKEIKKDSDVLEEPRIIEWLRRENFAFNMMTDAINDGDINEIRVLWRRIKKVIIRLHADELKILDDLEDKTALELEAVPA